MRASKEPERADMRLKGSEARVLVEPLVWKSLLPEDSLLAPNNSLLLEKVELVRLVPLSSCEGAFDLSMDEVQCR